MYIKSDILEKRTACIALMDFTIYARRKGISLSVGYCLRLICGYSRL